MVRLEAEFDERSRMVYGVVRLHLDDDGESPLLPVGLFVQAEIRGRRGGSGYTTAPLCHAR